MDPRHYYIIQTTNGIDKINFDRLFENCEYCNEIPKLMTKISHYVNFYDDVSDDKSYNLCSIISKKVQNI